MLKDCRYAAVRKPMVEKINLNVNNIKNNFGSAMAGDFVLQNIFDGVLNLFV